MIAIPAIDLRDGACVQLVGGEYAAERIRLPDPIAVALDWEAKGFQALHIVDLDAATGRGDNRRIDRATARHAPTSTVQVGGGIRDRDAIAWLIDAGATYVVVGTRALEDEEWLAEMADEFPQQLVVAADVRERKIVTRGWTRTMHLDIDEALERLSQLPLAGVLVTAVHKEGLMQGADLALMEDVAESTRTAGDREWRDCHRHRPSPARGSWRDRRGARYGALHRRARCARHRRGISRMSTVVRETKETQIRVVVTRGTGLATVDTTRPFLDHMLVTLARYSGLDLTVHARGDLPHHLIEDVAICVGAAIAAALPPTAARYADRTIPMDDALVQCALDLGGRPYYRGKLPVAIWEHWMRSFADNAKATLHLRVIRGTDDASHRRSRLQGARPRCARCVRRIGRGLQHQGQRGAAGLRVKRFVLTRRLIVCLDVKGGRVVKGVNFVGLRDVGDPVALATRYEAEGADEITFLDISASAEDRATLLDVARRTAERLFIPLTIGGGIRTADDVGRALRAGADKVSLNSAMVADPTVLTACAERFGAQCVVASIDAKLDDDGAWRVWTHGGRTQTALEAVAVGQGMRGARRRRGAAHQHRPRWRAHRLRSGADARRGDAGRRTGDRQRRRGPRVAHRRRTR